MEEKKLTDVEIVKALECTAGITQVDCDNCPFLINKFCSDTELATATLDLINRQKAEIERLTEREKFLGNAWHTSIEHTKTVERGLKASEARNAELKKQVEKLKEENEYLDIVAKQVLADYQTVQVQVDELEKELGKAYEIERANIQAEIADAGTSCHWCKNVTVKDTAKEIWNRAYKTACNTRGEITEKSIKDQAKRYYGVEVE